MIFNLSKKGFTLVEQIAAIAIISLVLVAFMPIFVSYYKNTYSTGARTTNTFQVKNEIDTAIQNPNSTDTSTSITNGNITLQLHSSDNNNIITTSPINGKVITSTSNNITISTFVPN